MAKGRPPVVGKGTPRVAVRVPAYIKAGVMYAADLCRTDVGNLMAAVFEKMADPKADDLPEELKVQALGFALREIYLSRLDDEKGLAVRGREDAEALEVATAAATQRPATAGKERTKCSSHKSKNLLLSS